MKNANTYLNQLRLLDVQIQQKEKELIRLREEAESITAKVGERVQSSTSDRLAADVANVVDIEKEIIRKRAELIITRHIVIDKIHELKNPILVEILYKRHVEYKSYKEIAAELKYNVSYVRQLHSKALNLL